AYLCVHGGIDSELVLDSRSSLEPIRKGQVLVCRPATIGARFIEVERDWQAGPDGGDKPGRSFADAAQILRVLPGAQASWFPADALTGTSGSPARYRISAAANRMGLRLDGPSLPWPGRDMLSEPVCPGSVQVTRDGQCIILGVD